MDTNDARQLGFDASEFRSAIKFAMRMGTPNPEDNRATFRWDVEKTYAVADANNNPYSWEAAPESETVYEDVQADVAVEFVTRSTLSGGNPIAEFDTPRAVLTILDVDWAIVIDDGNRPAPDKVLLGGNTYNMDFVAPDIGLFDVNVYQLHCSAVDAS